MSSIDFTSFLKLMAHKKASDLFITAGFPPAMKIDGKMTPVSSSSLSPVHTAEISRSIMTDKQAAEFEATKECNFAISPAGIGRFRVNAFVQQGRCGLVLRTITTTIPKSMVEVAGEPFIAHQLRDLHAQGVQGRSLNALDVVQVQFGDQRQVPADLFRAPDQS